VNCAYCGQDVFDNRKCVGCGARLKAETEPLVTRERRDPFAYNGYIIWPLRDYLRDTVEFQFWRGDTLVETIIFSWELWRNLNPDVIAVSTDPFKYVWQLFEIAQGNKDHLVIQEQNKRLPAMFVVSRSEHPLRSWTWEEAVEEYKLQGGDILR
jgi:hypothetical protein